MYKTYYASRTSILLGDDLTVAERVHELCFFLRVTADAENGRTAALLQGLHQIEEIRPHDVLARSNDAVCDGHLDGETEERAGNRRPRSLRACLRGSIGELYLKIRRRAVLEHELRRYWRGERRQWCRRTIDVRPMGCVGS